MIKVNCFLIAEYAVIGADSKLTIAGTYDGLTVMRKSGLEEGELGPIPFRNGYLAIVTEASLADGLTHQMRLRIINGNGEPIAEHANIPLAFALNPMGRPMRNNTVVELAGLKFPGLDDYVFELYLDDGARPTAEFTFSVAEPPRQDG